MIICYSSNKKLIHSCITFLPILYPISPPYIHSSLTWLKHQFFQEVFLSDHNPPLKRREVPLSVPTLLRTLVTLYYNWLLICSSPPPDRTSEEQECVLVFLYQHRAWYSTESQKKKIIKWITAISKVLSSLSSPENKLYTFSPELVNIYEMNE